MTLTIIDVNGQADTTSSTVTVIDCQGCTHAGLMNWAVKPAQKKFSITRQGPTATIYSLGVNDGSSTVWAYVQIVIQGDGGVNEVMYTQIVQLSPGQQINGDAANPAGDS